MQSYWAIFSTHFRLYLQYRTAALAGFGTQLFWGLIRVMIFAAFYRASKKPQPMTYEEVVSYIWLGQAMFVMIPWTVNRDLRDLIRSGGVAYELLRPLDLYFFWFCRILARRLAPTILRAIPMLIIASLFLGLKIPSTWEALAGWLLTTFGAFLLSSAFTAVTTISLLWTIAGEGVAQLSATIVILFSGLVIPLPLFPDWAQPIIAFLPFRGLGDVPFRAYIGHIPAEQILSAFMHQAIWIIALVVYGRLLLARGLKRLVVQGG